MKIKFNKDLPYQLLFTLCIAVPYLNNYELTFGLWVLAAALTFRKVYSYTILKYISAFAGIFLIAFIVAFFRDYKMYNYLRDIGYLLKPIVGLLLGYQLCKSHSIKPFHTLIYAGFLIAVIHIGILAESVVVRRIIHMHKLREYGGYFSDIEIYSLIILLFPKQFRLGMSLRRRQWLIAIIGFSSIMYVSRINFLQFIILFMAMKGYFVINRRSIMVMGSLVISIAVLYTILFNLTLTRNGKGLEAFFFKVRNAPIEAFKTKVSRDNWQDFNDNYRSYENIITVNQVVYAGPETTLFGKGMGSTVDLGRKIWTNDKEQIRHLPFLHNGFMTVFLKAGLVGLFLNLLFLYWICRPGRSEDDYVKQINRFMLGNGIFIILSTWVLMGLYLKTGAKSVVIGFLLCYRELYLKHKQLQSEDEQN